MQVWVQSCWETQDLASAGSGDGNQKVERNLKNSEDLGGCIAALLIVVEKRMAARSVAYSRKQAGGVASQGIQILDLVHSVPAR